MDEAYGRYLCSREWSVKKREVKRRCRGICERCGDYPMEHVHHLTYARKYNEDLGDLQGLCKRCHDFIHAISDYDPKIFADQMRVRKERHQNRCRIYNKADTKRHHNSLRKSKCPFDRFVASRLWDNRVSEDEKAEVLKAYINFRRWKERIDDPSTPSKFDYMWQETLTEFH